MFNPQLRDQLRELLVYEFELEQENNDKPVDNALRSCESWDDIVMLIDGGEL